MSERKEVYVLGHRNPDTDSICSAIAYADVKNKENDGNHYVAARAGQISSETSYVLQRFGMRQPTYVNNIGTRVRDMEIRKIPGINEGISMKKAWSMMAEMNAVTLPIVDANNVLDGIITINDIATSYMENQDSTMIAKAKTPYCNILETLEAKMLVGDPDAVFEHGNVVIAVANPDVMENYIEKDDMVITGNRYESQLSAIESGAGCILVCLGAEVSRSIQKLARDNNCAVLTTPLDTYTVAHRISQCMPVKAFMRTKDLVTFTPSDYTDAIKDTMQNTRIRDFPVIDKNGKYVGMISRRNLLGIRKRSVILVDHNERSQAVENIENAEILKSSITTASAPSRRWRLCISATSPSAARRPSSILFIKKRASRFRRRSRVFCAAPFCPIRSCSVRLPVPCWTAPQRKRSVPLRASIARASVSKCLPQAATSRIRLRKKFSIRITRSSSSATSRSVSARSTA